MKYLAIRDLHSLGEVCCGKIAIMTMTYFVSKKGEKSCAALIFNCTEESFWLIWRDAQAGYEQDAWYIGLIILVCC